jgi:hypothetical protein
MHQFKEKFLNDLDSEGFVEPSPPTFNIGKMQDHRIVQVMLADHKCLRCPPTENPPGWREVDGVELPRITWAEDAHLLAVNNHDGITRLSDDYAPDAFYGWKR